MLEREVNYYKVIIFKQTIFNEYHLEKTERFYSIEEAIDNGRKEKEKGKKVIIEEVLKIKNWS